MTNTTKISPADLTADGRTYRKFIRQISGCDIVKDADFAVSVELPCEECGTVETTALVSFDHEGTIERLCYRCAVTR